MNYNNYNPITLGNKKMNNIPCLDKSLVDCSINCDVFNALICYVNNNPNERYPSRKKKLLKNDKLFKSDQFVKVISRHLRFLNCRVMRIFASGDFDHISKKGKIEFKNVMDMAKKNKKHQFWLISRNFELLYNWLEIEKKKIPENIIYHFSADLKNSLTDFIKSFLRKYNIRIDYIVNSKKLSNCDSSKNGKSCQENNCSKCLDSKEDRFFYVHGKHNKKRLTSWKKGKKKKEKKKK